MPVIGTGIHGRHAPKKVRVRQRKHEPSEFALFCSPYCASLSQAFRNIGLYLLQQLHSTLQLVLRLYKNLAGARKADRFEKIQKLPNPKLRAPKVPLWGKRGSTFGLGLLLLYHYLVRPGAKRPGVVGVRRPVTFIV